MFPEAARMSYLKSFVEESVNEKTFAMACAMSTERKWLRLDKEWRKVLAAFQVPYFHINELSPRLNGPYKLWPGARRDAFIRSHHARIEDLSGLVRSNPPDVRHLLRPSP
jgi:hypothetical protein